MDRLSPRGWWVGWVDTPTGPVTLALNMDMTGEPDAAKRVEIGRELLRRLRVLP